MRALPILMIIAAASALQTQVPSTQQAPSRLEILKFSWQRRGPEPYAPAQVIEMKRPSNETEIKAENGRIPPDYNKAGDPENSENSKPRMISPKPSPATDKTFKYLLRVRNNGTIAISGMRWTYTFTDPISRQEIVRRSFESIVKIAPGKEKTVTAFSGLGPPTVVNVAAMNEKNYSGWEEIIVIDELKFEDGTNWKR